MSPSIDKYVEAGLEILFPPACAFCGGLCRLEPGFPGICRTCLPSLPLRRQQENLLSWADLSHKNGLAGGFVPDNAAIYCASWYRDSIRQALLRLKFADSPDLAVALAALLTQTLRQHGVRGRAVMAVPLHSRRLRERGYNQSGLLAQSVARQLLLPDWSIYLKRIRATDRQSAVESRFGRAVNLAGAFGLAGQLPGGPHRANHGASSQREPVPGGLIILIDDILTTGATLTAAGAPLWAAGYAVAGLVVASESHCNGSAN